MKEHDIFPRDQRIAELAQELPVTMPDERRREELRTSIIAAAETLAVRTPPRPVARIALFAGPLAMAAAIALWIWAAPGASSTPHAPVASRVPVAEPVAPLPTVADLAPQAPPTRGTVRPAAHARFEHRVERTAEGSSEIVRLSEGQITVDVAKLATGERFRVVAGDGEVEVRGTSFDVEVEGDQLLAVRVHEGRVEVRPAGHDMVTLLPGESWTRPAPEPAIREAPVPDADIVMEPEEAPAPTTRKEKPPRAAAVEDSIVVTRGPEHLSEPEPPRGASPAPTEPKRPKGEPPPAQVNVMPTAAEKTFGLGWAALKAGRFEEAERHLARTIVLEPDSPWAEDARYFRGIALARAGDRTAAAAAFRDFLARHPKSSRAPQARTFLERLVDD